MSVSARDVRFIPLSQLRRGSANPRKLGDPDYAGMAASLKAVGQLQNIIVVPLGEDLYAVRAGDRRFGGFCLLRDRGDVLDDHPVLCLVTDALADDGVSATENMQRLAMHPADEWDACRQMQVAGMTVDAIADVLGCTPLVVERRLAVGGAAPQLIELYRTSNISTDQLIALCATEDHALQISTWQNVRDKDPKELRRHVLSAEVDAAADARVEFIGGVGTYVAAGGTVRRDLFSNAVSGGFIKDTALLNRLVRERLERESAQLQSSEGWSWVIAEASWNREAWIRFGRITPCRRQHTQAELEDLARLRAEDANLLAEQGDLALNARLKSSPQRTADIADRRVAIAEAVASISQASLSYSSEEKAYAGVVVWLDAQGQVHVERGLVRPEDRAALSRAKRTIAGGRETKAVGRKAHAMSKAVQDSLICYRNTAAQVAISMNTRAAKLLFACKVICDELDIPGCPISANQSSGDGQSASDHGVATLGVDEQVLADRLSANGKAAMGRIPSSPVELWRTLEGKTDAELDGIMAYGVAKMLRLGDGRNEMAGLLLEAMAFDVGSHYTPTAANFFSRVPKEFAIAALLESGRFPNADSLSGMAKHELAALAEREIVGTRWVPPVMRITGSTKLN